MQINAIKSATTEAAIINAQLPASSAISHRQHVYLGAKMAIIYRRATINRFTMILYGDVYSYTIDKQYNNQIVLWHMNSMIIT